MIAKPTRHPTRPSHQVAKTAAKHSLVQFFGDCYALLTEWAELPVLNDLLGGSENDGNAKLTSAKRHHACPTGDFVLFRAGGDKEFMRLIAEEGLGEDRVLSAFETIQPNVGSPALRRLGRWSRGDSAMAG